jgi:formylmethanofuran dehydrogenase subunit E
VARILLLLAIGFAIYLLFRGFFRAQVKDAEPSAAKDVEDMVACSICGVNMPRSESKEEGGRITCRDPAACKHAK